MAEVIVKYIHRVYATVIIDGGRTYNSVMERDKEPVSLALIEKGYNVDEAGDIHPIETQTV